MRSDREWIIYDLFSCLVLSLANFLLGCANIYIYIYIYIYMLHKKSVGWMLRALMG